MSTGKYSIIKREKNPRLRSTKLFFIYQYHLDREHETVECIEDSTDLVIIVLRLVKASFDS